MPPLLVILLTSMAFVAGYLLATITEHGPRCTRSRRLRGQHPEVPEVSKPLTDPWEGTPLGVVDRDPAPDQISPLKNHG